MISISSPLESGPGYQTVRPLTGSYRPMAAADFKDEPAKLTARQASFYRNLIAIAQEMQSGWIPVVLNHQAIGPVYLDRGCIKIAEHAGFIRSLVDGASGTVEMIELSFKVTVK